MERLDAKTIYARLMWAGWPLYTIKRKVVDGKKKCLLVCKFEGDGDDPESSEHYGKVVEGLGDGLHEAFEDAVRQIGEIESN